MVQILAASSLVIGCSNLPAFPAQMIYESIPSKNICAEYKIIKEKPLTVEYQRDLPLADCPVSIFGFSPSDASAVMDWIRAVQFNRGKR